MDSAWRPQAKRLQTTENYMRRLKLETCLEGHIGCVNCLEWNQKGSLLASGSDDQNVIIWDPFRGVKSNQIVSGHSGNIFSVKFMPDTCDTSIATCASDGAVRVTDCLTNQSLLACKSCHEDRVKRLAVHPNQPNLVWSAGEDGCVMQYDLRQPHICSPRNPRYTLIDLAMDRKLIAKCLAVNPTRDEMLAVGSSDASVLVFDRRMIVGSRSSRDFCVATLIPGHLARDESTRRRCFGVTYVAFNADGSELLANVHAEQVYLFNTYQKWDCYSSFETTIRPLIENHDKVDDKSQTTDKSSEWSALQKYCKATKLSGSDLEFYDSVKDKKEISAKDLHQINELLAKNLNCPQLYHLRAKALLQRAWIGDIYQAIRDSCCALALDPFDLLSYENLATATHWFDDGDSRDLMNRLRSIVESKQDQSKMLDVIQTRKEQTNDEHESWLDVYLKKTEADIARYSEMFYKSNKPKSKSSLDASNAISGSDYRRRFCGHCNMNTDIKEANFFGDFVVAGSDDGAFYIWNKKTSNLVKAVQADFQILNCLQPHPSICMLATSGIEPTVKLWSPSGKTNLDVKSPELRCNQNQKFLVSDPFEVMLGALWPDH